MIVLKRKTITTAFVWIVVLVSLNLWSFRIIGDNIYKQLEALICALLVVIVLFNLNIFKQKGHFFKINVLLFLLLPLLSVYGAHIYHDQPIHLSLLLYRLNIFWLFYFVLHLFNIDKEKIIRIIIIVGVIWCFLTIVQQFTYPYYYFYIRGDDRTSFYRDDIYRFMLAGEVYGLFMLIYFFYKYTTTQKMYNLLFVVLGLLAFYFYGTRQVAAAVIVVIFLSLFYIKGLSKLQYFILLPIIGALVINFLQPSLLKNYIESTSTQLDDDNYIRFLAADFYLNDYWPHWSAKIIGNGRHHQDSSYGEEMANIISVFDFWRSDVGIIGTFNTYGILYVLNIFWVNIKGMFLKIKSQRDKYLKLFFFYFFMLLILSENYSNGTVIPFLCLIFYLVDKSIAQEDKCLKVLQQTEIKEIAN
jgi:hypothetical protein